ncbi:MAG: serine hydrolase domain-containing protein, partial [Myxococcota bacterium]
PNYALGGLAVEIAADEPFAALMQRKVLAPLGMNDSGYRVEGFADDSFAWGNTLDPQTGALIEERDLTGRYCGALFPSGGLVSTIDDLSRFAAMLLNGGDPVLSPTAYQTLTGGGWRFSETSGYGLGIQSNTYYGHRALLHTGGLNGYQAIMWLFPDDGLGVIVFATVDHHVIEPPVSSSRPIHHIAEHIVQTFLDDVPIQDRPPPSFVPEKEWESRFAGRYTSEQELGEVEIIYEDGSLWMHRLDADVREQLLPYSKSSFSIPRRGSNGRTYYPTVQFIVEDEQAQHLLTSEGIATRQAR